MENLIENEPLHIGVPGKIISQLNNDCFVLFMIGFVSCLIRIVTTKRKDNPIFYVILKHYKTQI